MKLTLRGRSIEFPRRPLVMGIININDDSFSGDGTLDADAALHRATEMVAAGADIIDVGAESARTNREAISEDVEIARLGPFFRTFHDSEWRRALQVADSEQIFPPVLSVNTWRPAVVATACAAGAGIINDIAGLADDTNARLCASAGTALLIMHTVGAPKVPHTHVGYPNVMQGLDKFFAEKIDLALRAGLSRDAIILDPGIDFAKQRDDNLRIYRELDQLSRFGRPILLPVSRKTVIGEVLGLADPTQRDAGTVACIVSGMERGASIFRVHNVRAAFQTVKVVHAVRSA